MGLGSALGSIGSSVVSGALGYLGAHSANQAAMAMSREQMEWQERMSNTAHQREVKDLRAAGLNPILSATGGNGASSGSYTIPSLQNEFGDFGNEINKGVNSALTALQTESNVNKQDAEIDQIKANIANINSSTKLINTQNDIQMINAANQQDLTRAEIAARLAQAFNLNSNSAFINASRGQELVLSDLYKRGYKAIEPFVDQTENTTKTLVKGYMNGAHALGNVFRSIKGWFNRFYVDNPNGKKK